MKKSKSVNIFTAIKNYYAVNDKRENILFTIFIVIHVFWILPFIWIVRTGIDIKVFLMGALYFAFESILYERTVHRLYKNEGLIKDDN